MDIPTFWKSSYRHCKIFTRNGENSQIYFNYTR